VTEKLSMPYSPRWHAGRLWLLNSGTGYLGTVDLATGVFEPRVFCPGFLHGLAFHNGHAIVGLSLPRDGSFSGLELDNELKRRDADHWCGIQIQSRLGRHCRMDQARRRRERAVRRGGAAGRALVRRHGLSQR
jgi:uncharacterized protein (TIGR03032 family)